MDTAALIQLLAHPDPRARIDAARTLGMLDEVDALPALAAAFKRETVPDVQDILQHTGRRLQQVQAQGYTTFAALWRHFNIQREVEAAIQRDSPEAKFPEGLSAEAMDRLYDEMRLERQKRKIDGKYSLNGRADLNRQSEASVPGTGDLRAHKRLPPVAPSTQDIRPHVRRLLQNPDAAARRRAALTLGDINNPEALLPLARAYAVDPAAEVGEAAQQSGKRLYWNVLYSALEADGTITAEVQRRIQAAGQVPGKIETGELERRKIENFLRQAQDKRQNRR